MVPSSKRIAIFGLISKHPGRNRGGTAVSISRLAAHFAEAGYSVDILVRRPPKDHFLLEAPPPGATFRFFSTSSKISLFLSLVAYVMRARPHSLLALDTRANLIAAWLKLLPGIRVNVWASLRNALNGNNRGTLKTIARRCDGIIAISEGLAKDFRDLTGVSKQKIHVVYNPVYTPELHHLAAQKVDHPWFHSKDRPIVMGIGRLVRQKDFATLIRAYAQVRKSIGCRLAIIGEGELQSDLERLAVDLGIAQDVTFLGFQKNPWAYLRHADVFVLSSAYEGFGNVLAEALALGISAVSTDCPSGPREILENGRLGPLVPVGDVHQLAKGIEGLLKSPSDPRKLIEAARKYRSTVCGTRYLEIMGLPCPEMKS